MVKVHIETYCPKKDDEQHGELLKDLDWFWLAYIRNNAKGGLLLISVFFALNIPLDVSLVNKFNKSK